MTSSKTSKTYTPKSINVKSKLIKVPNNIFQQYIDIDPTKTIYSFTYKNGTDREKLGIMNFEGDNRYEYQFCFKRNIPSANDADFGTIIISLPDRQVIDHSKLYIEKNIHLYPGEYLVLFYTNETDPIITFSSGKCDDKKYEK